MALTKMKNETRNLENINKLAPHTRMAALDWYEQLKKEGIEVLVYETTRTLKQQQDNVQSGASQTLKSYHLVSQALDWVLVDSKGKALWNDYKTVKGKRVVEIAKKYGFESGGDWKTFKDYPHLQFKYKGYGKDYIAFPGTIHIGSEGEFVKDVQNFLNVTVDGKFGKNSEKALKEYQKANGLVADGLLGIRTFTKMFR